MQEKYRLLACQDCRKKFSLLTALNTHILRSGHNDRKKITVLDVVETLGVFPIEIFGVRITAKQIMSQQKMIEMSVAEAAI